MKTDFNLAAKLRLREHFLDSYHADGLASVMDCCQGDGVIWRHLRPRVLHYWGMDLKPKKGRLAIDSAKVLAQPGWTQNVVDIDTYGAPWSHWFGVLRNLSQPTTVFLTVGSAGVAGHITKELRERMGMQHLRGPKGLLCRKIDDFAIRFALGLALDVAEVVEALEAPRSRRARYFGIRLEPLYPTPRQTAAV